MTGVPIGRRPREDPETQAEPWGDGGRDAVTQHQQAEGCLGLPVVTELGEAHGTDSVLHSHEKES